MHDSARSLVRLVLLPVAVAGLGLAALKHPNEWTVMAVTTPTVLALMAAVVAARFAAPGSRPYFWGFAAIGWAYLVLAFGIGGSQVVMRGDLFSSVLIDQALEATFGGARAQMLASNFNVMRDHFHAIGHALFALLFAHAAGLFAAGLARRQADERAAATPSRAPTT